MRAIRMPLFILFMMSLLSCQSAQSGKVPYPGDVPAKILSNYQFDMNAAAVDRIYDAPPVLLKYLKELDANDSYSAYRLTEKEQALFRQYFSYLPDAYRRHLDKKLIGIYFIENFTGAGLSDYVFDQSGIMYVILVINPAVLKYSLEDWISYRENSPFQGDSRITVKNRLGSKYKGLLYLLIHESSHLYDYTNRVTPYTEPDLVRYGFSREETSFVRNVWKEYSLPVEKYDFQNRIKASSYGLGRTLDSGTIVDIYQSLEKTPFTSLYGSKNWAEDFAETFTWFYVKQKFNIEYSAKILVDNKPVFLFRPLQNKTAAARYDELTRIIK